LKTAFPLSFRGIILEDMSTNQATPNPAVPIAPIRVGRPPNVPDRRRGRSRSPSAYLQKKGKSLTGLLFGPGQSRKNVKSSASASLSSQKPAAAFPSSTKAPTDQPVVATTPATTPAKTEASEADIGATIENLSPPVSFDEDENTESYVIMDESSPAQTGLKKVLQKSEKAVVPELETNAVVDTEPESVVKEDKKAVDASVISDSKAPKESAVSSKIADSVSRSLEETKVENVQVILLLMAFTSRRFELLQLEFDPNKALVSDILAQVSTSATEEELRSQNYVGICNIAGSEFPAELLLRNVVQKENEVMLAISEGVTAPACAKLAAPILNDSKVRAMVSISLNSIFFRTLIGIVSKVFTNLFRLSDQLGHSPPVVESAPRKIEKPSAKVEPIVPKSTPIIVPVLGNTGDIEPVKKEEAISKQEKTAGTETLVSSKEATLSSESKIAEILVGQADPVPIEAGGGPGASALKVVLALLVIVAVVPLTMLHARITSPLGPGDRLKAGQFRRKCGITSLTQDSFNGCSELSAEFDDKGVLTVYNLGSMLSDNKTVLYRLMAEKATQSGGELFVGADGSLTIGGKPVLVEVPSQSNPDLSPWPFAKSLILHKKTKRGGKTVWHIVS